MPEPLVHAISHWQGYLGYCVHAREFFGRLSRRVPLLGTEWQQNSPNFRDADVFRDRARIARELPRRTVVSIGLSLGSAFCILKDAPGPRVGYTVWDSTHIPYHWHAPLGMVDRVWVPSEWARGVLASSAGVDPARVDVMPEGVDTRTFRPDGPVASNIAGLDGYKFLIVGKFETRKATAEMIRAFDAEFANDKAWLVLSVFNHFTRGFDIRRELRALDLKHPEKLIYVPPLPTHADLARLYRSCDAFLGASRAEGWGLCHIEAAACGLPLVTTRYSAPAEWAAPHAYFIDHEMTKIDFIERIYCPDDYFGEWAEPDWGQFRRTMRHLFDNRDEAKARGTALAGHVRDRYSWDHAADKGAALVRKLAG